MMSGSDERTTQSNLDAMSEEVSVDKGEQSPETPKPAPATAPAIPEPVDHGLVPMLQIVGCFALWTNCWGLYNAYGEFQTFYQQTFLPSQTPDQISWIGSIQAFLLLLVGALAGVLYDAGYLRALLIVGNVLVVFGTMMTSLCTKYWQLILAQGIVTGIGFGLLFTVSITVIPQWFVKRRALANGLAASGSGVGGVIYSVVFRTLRTSIGFGWAVRVLGSIALFFGIVSVVTVRSKFGKLSSQRNFLQLDAIRQAPFSIFVLGSFVAFIAVYIPFFYIQPYSLAQGVSDNLSASYLVVFINAGSALGRLVLSSLAGKYGFLNVYILTGFISTVLVFCWIAIHNAAGLVVFSWLYGVFAGALLGLVSVAAIPLMPDLRQLGTWLGQSLLVLSLGVLIGTPISGAIVRSSNGFLGLQIFCGVVFLVGSIILVVARGLKTSWKVAVKI